MKIVEHSGEWLVGSPNKQAEDEQHYEGPAVLCGVMMVLIAVFMALFAWGAFTAEPTPGEWQKLAAAAAVVRGETLYQDIWDSHGPMSTWAVALYIGLGQIQTYNFIYDLRAAMLVLLYATVLIGYLLAREVFAKAGFLPLMATVVMLSAPCMYLQGIQIHGENPTHLLFLIAMYIWFRANRTHDLMKYAWAGLAVGLCFFFTAKAMFLVLAIGLLFLGDMWRHRSWELRALGHYCAGWAAPLFLLFLMLLAGGGLDSFIGPYIRQAYAAELDANPIQSVIGEAWLTTSSLFVIYTIIQIVRGKTPERITLITPVALYFIVQFSVLTPTPVSVGFLPLTLPAGILIAWGVMDIMKHLPFERIPGSKPDPRALRSAAAACFFVFLAMSTVFALPLLDNAQLGRSIREGNAFTGYFEEDEYVFDGYGHPLFQPKASRYYSLTQALENGFADDQSASALVRLLEDRDLHYLILDDRVRQLPLGFRNFIRDNFIPLSQDPVYAAGLVIDRPGEIKIDIAGSYHFTGENGEVLLRIDGRAVRNPVRLKDGTYRLYWNQGGRIALCIRPPEDWAAWSEIHAQELDHWQPRTDSD